MWTELAVFINLSLCHQLVSRPGGWSVEGRRPDVMAGRGEYTGGMAAGQLWASVIRVLGMLEGSGPVGKGLSIPRGRWPEELREKGAVTK